MGFAGNMYFCDYRGNQNLAHTSQSVVQYLVKETSTVCHSSFGRYPHPVEGHRV